MQPRKLMITIEVLSGIPSREFSKTNMQGMFDGYFVDKEIEEILEVHQVRTQVVKENK